LREIVDANRLEWMRLELDTVSFPIEPAAREAILCIREDGLTLYDVAAMSHRNVGRKALALEDIDSELSRSDCSRRSRAESSARCRSTIDSR
jgi:hypothetical protein